MQKLYLYLASRSKRGIKLITVLTGKPTVRTPVQDLTTLGLPPVWQREIQRIMVENHMLYEAWIESAPNYNTLRERLKAKGFTNIPMGAPQMINLLQFGKPPQANVSSAKATQTMLQKRKA